MKSRTRLDSAVFQLTPTRTRYTLVINGNGETERISSGLLNPFLAHMKAAQDQFVRGCYSIMLEPNPASDAIWFTKGTVQRFVRFVSAPDVLEHVNMTESEIVQIKEAIAIQNNGTLSSNNVKDHKKLEDWREKYLENIEGSLPEVNVHAEDKIVIHKVGAPPTNLNGVEERENSKIQFLTVLETRKSVLQRQQSLAFARAVAAGYDMDHIMHLVSFSECFGAPRLIKACLGFMVLWKRNHGHLFKFEANEASVGQSECSDFKEALSDYNCKGMEGYRKAANVATAVSTFDQNKGNKSSSPFYQSLQGMPCNNHLGGDPILQSPYPQVQGPKYSKTISSTLKKHLMDRKKDNKQSETLETNVSYMRPDDSSEMKHLSQGQEQLRKAGRSCKKKSGVVFIHNITYISSEGRDGITLDPDDKEAEGLSIGLKHNQKQSASCGKIKESCTRSTDTCNSYDNKETTSDVVHTGNWQAFQNILLQHNNNNTYADQVTSAQEEEILLNGQKRTANDPILLHEQVSYEVQDWRKNEYYPNGGKKTHLLSASSSKLISYAGESGRRFNDSLVDPYFIKTRSGRGGYEKAVNGGFAIYDQKTRTDYQNFSSDPLVECGLEDASKNIFNNSSGKVIEESFKLSQRSDSTHKSNTDSVIPVNENELDSVRRQLSYEQDDFILLPKCEIVKESIGYGPAADHETKLCCRSNVTGQNRIKEESATGVEEIPVKSVKDIKARGLHDSAAINKSGKMSKLICLAQVQDRGERIGSSKSDFQKMKKTKEEKEIKQLEALKRERERRIAARSSSGPAQLTSSQMRPELITISPISYENSKFSKLEPHGFSPLQNLPNITASLGSNVPQKIKTTKKVNKINPSQSALSSQMRLQPQSKVSPVSYKGSKFSDSEPGPSSPVQRLRSRAASLKSNASQITRVGLNGTNQNALQKSIWLASPEPSNGNFFVTPERKVSASHICKLSDPPKRNMECVSSANLDTHTSPNSKLDAAGVPRLPNSKTSNRHHISPTKLQTPYSLTKPDSITSNRHHISPTKLQTPYSLTRNRHHISPIKPQTPYSLTKPKEADGYRVESISKSQVSRGKRQVAVGPNFKSKLLKRPSDIVQNKTIELSLKKNCGSSVTVKAMQVQESNEEPLHNRNGEDKQVIETTVVLENETSLIPIIQVDREMIDTIKESNTHEDDENTGVTSKDVAIPSATSPVDVKELNKHEDGETAGITTDAANPAAASPVDTKDVGGSAACHFENSLYSDKVKADYDIKKLLESSSTDISAAPYQSTFVAMPSLEDPCITYLESTNVSPSASEITEIIVEAALAPASDFNDSTRFEKTPGSICKPQVKVISKGISKIFRFGRTIRKQNLRSKRLVDKGAVVTNCFASTASTNEGQGCFRETMSYALYIA